MNKIKKLKLIEGDFSCNEAKEILTSMFNSKINFITYKIGVLKSDLERTMKRHKRKFHY